MIRGALAILLVVLVAVAVVTREDELALRAGPAQAAPARSELAQARLLIRRLWGARAREAFCVVFHESRWQPAAVSPTLDVGLFQVNYAAHHRPGEGFAAFRRRLSRPLVNVAFAWALYREAGWRPWAVRGSCV